MWTRITKTMAEDAAIRMVEKKYNPLLREARVKLDSAVECLVQKYYPTELIDMAKKYEGTKFVSVSNFPSVFYENGGKKRYFYGKTSFPVMSSHNAIEISEEEGAELESLEREQSGIHTHAKKMLAKLTVALIKLRTYKRIEKELPEALEFIEEPEPKDEENNELAELRESLK